MTINKKVLSLFLLLAGSSAVLAQDPTDALRYSYLSTQGTARSVGFGNALGSIGGDFSALSVNPAGIGVYRKSEFTFSPSINANSSNTTYLGEELGQNATRFSIANMGLVFTNALKGKRYNSSPWKSTSFAFGINRVADFNSNYVYQGNNSGSNSSSISERFAFDANANPSNTTTQGTPAWFGYQSYLVNYDTAQRQYTTTVPFEDGIRQLKNVKQRGGISDFAISFGGNYDEKLLIGATVGIPLLTYKRESEYTETALQPATSPDFTALRFKESLQTTGTGLNLKLGAIYVINESFRLGGAIHTPTVWGMKDIYDVSIYANTNGLNPSGDQTIQAPTNVYEYTMVTPWRGILSASAIIGKKGFISVDYEYVRYQSARFNFGGDDDLYELDLNQYIKNNYKGGSNIRIGGELNLNPIRLRAGWGYMGSPYKNYADASRMSFSGGVGFKFENTTIDLGFIHSSSQAQEQPYATPYSNVTVPTAVSKNSYNNAVLTVGFRF